MQRLADDERSRRMSDRPRGRRPEPETSPFGAAAFAWLDSPAARSAAAGFLHRQRLRVPVNEVVDTARTKIWMRLQSPHDDLDPAGAGAYCRRVMRNLVSDLLRGFDADPLDDESHHTDDDSDGYDQFDDDPFDDDRHTGSAGDVGRSAYAPASDPVGGGLLDQVRGDLETSGQQDWVVSAALTYFTLEMYTDCDRSGAPWPQAGAALDRALLWPSLWFAGKRAGLFPDGSRHSATQRQRLKRAGDPVLLLVASVKEKIARGGAA
jgi:hypothetical protein